jgi:hypothetical protein
MALLVFGLASICTWVALAFSWWAGVGGSANAPLPSGSLLVIAAATGAGIVWRAYRVDTRPSTLSPGHVLRT